LFFTFLVALAFEAARDLVAADFLVGVVDRLAADFLVGVVDRWVADRLVADRLVADRFVADRFVADAEVRRDVRVEVDDVAAACFLAGDFDFLAAAAFFLAGAFFFAAAIRTDTSRRM
jgi:hypothetical protein